MESAEKIVEEWNKRYPVGTPVVLDHGKGNKTVTKTRSEAYIIAGRLLIRVEGLIGPFDLGIAKPVEE